MTNRQKIPDDVIEKIITLASPKEALRWLPASKRCNAAVVKGRMNMERYENCMFVIGSNMTLGDIGVLTCHRRIRIEFTSNNPAPKATLLEFDRVVRGDRVESDPYFNWMNSGEYYKLTDSSTAGKKRLLAKIVQWFELPEASFRLGSDDIEVLRPLVDAGICIELLSPSGQNDDRVIDAIDFLGMRNVTISLSRWTDSALERLKTMEFDSVRLGEGSLLPIVNSKSLFFRYPLLSFEKFAEGLAEPWSNGDLPRLECMKFHGDGAFIPDGRFEPVDYVLTPSEERERNDCQVRVYLLSDKKSDRYLELKLYFLKSKPYYQPYECYEAVVHVLN